MFKKMKLMALCLFGLTIPLSGYAENDWHADWSSKWHFDYADKLSSKKNAEFLGMYIGLLNVDIISDAHLKECRSSKDKNRILLVCHRLGQLYLSQENYSEAIKYLNRSANAGHPESQALLGEMYYFGTGVKQNKRTAVEWLKKAINHKFPYPGAQHDLAAMYYFGEGVKQDRAKSKDLFNKACQSGLQEACNELNTKF
ncbi:tetratricopeptide repeat protein [Lonepinella sp. BR2271]|uniref:tetratricopeptide repeat protein n=1 Tax=Lonepinella sp. BR2271 TaxID=3434550 RepID=UPI003F6DBA4B